MAKDKMINLMIEKAGDFQTIITKQTDSMRKIIAAINMTLDGFLRPYGRAAR
jgi:hypothetical protein